MGNLMSYGTPGLIWGCVMFAIIVLMYVPFVKAYDKQLLENESAASEE
jgi:cellobiose-specific phosphotransferase system component IIC